MMPAAGENSIKKGFMMHMNPFYSRQWSGQPILTLAAPAVSRFFKAYLKLLTTPAGTLSAVFQHDTHLI